MAKINASPYPKGTSSRTVKSGCTAHICYNRSIFSKYEPITNMNVEMGSKASAEVAGRITIIAEMQCGSYFTRWNWSVYFTHRHSFIRYFLGRPSTKKTFKMTFEVRCVLFSKTMLGPRQKFSTVLFIWFKPRNNRGSLKRFSWDLFNFDINK